MEPAMQRRLILLMAALWGLALITAAPSAALAAPVDVLENRLEAWPAWSLPAPLSRPGRSDLIYPAWFAGRWQLSSLEEPLWQAEVRFVANAQGQIVGDRAGNAAAIGRALLGEQLRRVQDDPRNPNRQLALLEGDQQLESSVVGRRRNQPADDLFLADELALQVLHGPGPPRQSRVETLSRYRLLAPGTIAMEQWQVSYGSPADGLVSGALRSSSSRMELRQLSSDPPPP
jgi:hypothetical protein